MINEVTLGDPVALRNKLHDTFEDVSNFREAQETIIHLKSQLEEAESKLVSLEKEQQLQKASQQSLHSLQRDLKTSLELLVEKLGKEFEKESEKSRVDRRK